MAKIRFRRVERRRSLIAYGVLLLITLLTLIIAAIRQPGGFSAEVLLIVLAGFVAVGFQRQAGFPELLQRTISNRLRYVLPLLTGLLFALPDVILVKFIQTPGPYETLPLYFQPFPFSVLHYVTGAIYSEVYFRLIIFTLLMALARNYLSVRYYDSIFWTLAVLTAAWEPLAQWPQGPTWFVLYCVLSGFAFNLIQAWYYKKAGFLAALSVRLGHYLLWHVLLGLYVELFEMSK
jgi:hypothetical protein